MYDFYGVYAACRDAAWRCHLDFGISRLPVRLKAITTSAGIRIVRNSDAEELRDGERGASICVNNIWTLIYDDSLPSSESRMVVAHELGHILLGHDYKYAGCRFPESDKKQKSEREADMFAVRLLAPACILHEIGVMSAAGIAELCDIPAPAAAARARRMGELEKRSKFYQSALEAEVAARFSAFIAEKRALSDGNPSSFR